MGRNSDAAREVSVACPEVARLSDKNERHEIKVLVVALEELGHGGEIGQLSEEVVVVVEGRSDVGGVRSELNLQ